MLISYRRTPDTRRRVGALAAFLRRQGIDAWFDGYEAEPPDGWYDWSLAAIQAAHRVLVVCDPAYHACVTDPDAGDARGRGVVLEWRHIQQRIVEQKSVQRFIPVGFDRAHAAHRPPGLDGGLVYVGDDEGIAALIRILNGIPEEEAPPSAPAPAPSRRSTTAPTGGGTCTCRTRRRA